MREDKGYFSGFVLPVDPEIKDLLKYSKICLRKKRMVKKFSKNFFKYLPENIIVEYLSKVMVRPIRRALNYGGIGRKIFMVEELPLGDRAKYE